jgi:hypothetical protein
VPALTPDALAALVAAACPGCGARRVRVHALATGVVPYLDGEPSGTIAWTWHDHEHRDRAHELETLAKRAHRIECAECRRVAFERAECVVCGAAGGAARSLAGRHGVAAPEACPLCAWSELDHTVEARMHVDFLGGAPARRVLDADPADRADPGWHVTQVVCQNCESTVATASQIRCVACGRSSLVRRPS